MPIVSKRLAEFLAEFLAGFFLFVLFVIFLNYFAFLPVASFNNYYNPLSGPNSFTETDLIIITLLTAAVASGSLTLLFLIRWTIRRWSQLRGEEKKSQFKLYDNILIGVIFLIFVAMFSFPSFVYDSRKESIKATLQDVIYPAVGSEVPSNVLDVRAFVSSKIKNNQTPTAVPYNLNGNQFSRDDILGVVFDYPQSVEDLDYVFVFRDKRKLLNSGLTGNIFSRSLGVESRKNFQIYSVDVEVGIFDWVQKRLVAKGIVENRYFPERMSASDITERADPDGNIFFRAGDYALGDWFTGIFDTSESSPEKMLSKYRGWIHVFFIFWPIVLFALLVFAGGVEKPPHRR